jgi:peptide/nickel transport system permease protein
MRGGRADAAASGAWRALRWGSATRSETAGTVIAYIVRRLLAAIPLLLLISFAVFSLTFLIPGDPARQILGSDASLSAINHLRRQLGLDQPLLVQYWHWLTNALHGNLGHSILKNTAVSTEIAHRFPVTFSIAIGALALTVVVGVPLGVVAATRPGSPSDRLVTITTSMMLAIPDFWLAILLVLLFSVKLKVLPAIGYVPFSSSPAQWAIHLCLPWIAAGFGGAATLARQLRGALAETLEQDYIRTAHATGIRGSVVILKHAMKNASIAPVTVVGIMFAYTLGGTVILEYIFSIPGLGQYFYQALNGKDVPVIQGVILLVALTFVLINLAVDILYAYLNPKVRLG